ncbi:MAG: GAF domain-containing protein [Phycisphaerales bacterium]|nr:GAF domain-containing protein [Phycisphaerales bacterium]
MSARGDERAGVESGAGRDYAPLLSAARAAAARGAMSRTEAMTLCCDLVWDAFGLQSACGGAKVSWVGFYERAADADEMILVVRRDKPACSPIGLHGACGRCWKERRALVIADVSTLGAGYIACDPKDKAELVLPMMDERGCWGVLDVDSFEIGAFGEHDARGMAELCRLLGLTQ